MGNYNAKKGISVSFSHNNRGINFNFLHGNFLFLLEAVLQENQTRKEVLPYAVDSDMKRRD